MADAHHQEHEQRTTTEFALLIHLIRTNDTVINHIMATHDNERQGWETCVGLT